jgi:hypothetical protein
MMATSHIVTLMLVLLMISSSLSRSTSLRRLHPSFIAMSQNKRKALSSTAEDGQPQPVYRAEGLLAVHKPLTWTSQDVGKRNFAFVIAVSVDLSL